MSKMQPKIAARSKWLTLASRCIAVVAIAFLASRIFVLHRQLPELPWGLVTVFTILLGMVSVLLQTICSSWAWAVLLRGGGVWLSVWNAFLILGKSQIYKYLPGNVFQYVGRVGLGVSFGVPTEPVLLSSGVEALLSLGAAAMMASIGFYLERAQDFPLAVDGSRMLVVGVVVLAVGVASLFLGPLRRWISSRIQYLHPGRMAVAIGFYCVNLLLNGLMLAYILHHLWGLDVSLSWYSLAWRSALAWVLGAVTPGAPAGIGVRESVLVLVLAHHVPEPIILSTALLIRFTGILGELATAALVYLMGRQHFPTPREA